MGRASAYVLLMNNDVVELFQEAIDEYGRYAEAVYKFDHSRNAPLICFIINQNQTITHIARARRGMSAGTYQSRLNLTDIKKLTTELQVSQIVSGVPSKVKHWAADRLENGGLISPKTFEHVIDVVANLAPEIKTDLQRFTKISRQRIERLSIAARETLGQQKEAVSTALLLGGMDRTALSEWTLDDDETPGSFLDGLEQSRQREDPMIVNDMMNVPGYEYIKSVPIASAAYFEDGSKKLTVILANRLPLEEQTGTDLIYYNQTFKAFVMVQYKAMEQDNKLGAIFRFPEKQLSEEIERMDLMMEELSKAEVSDDLDEFRLSNNPFFLKFCPRIQFQPDSSKLTTGMYLPLPYWKKLQDSETMKGPRGGCRLTYKNVGRYLDNTAFATMVGDAWVGTSIEQSKLLEDWIKQVISSGKSIMFAIKKDDPDSPAESHETNPYIDLEGENPLDYEEEVAVVQLEN